MDLPASVDVAVIGGGQSALAFGYHLRRIERGRTARGLPPLRVVVLDAHPAPGGAWQDMWPTLHLFSPAEHSSLPGRLMPGTSEEYPDAAHVVEYLTDHERRFGLDVRRPVRVFSLTAGRAGGLVLRTDDGVLDARHVVNATGTWDRRFIASLPGLGTFRGQVLHTRDYRDAESLEDARVLVVGGGNSAAQIAADLLGTAAVVRWAARRPPQFLPDDVDGRTLFEVASQAVAARAAGEEHAGVGSLGDVVAVASVRRARDEGGLVARAMPARFTPDGVQWPDGSTERFDAVVLATGFRPALDHLRGLGLTWRGGHPAASAPPGSPFPVRSADDPRLWFLGYGDWCGAASATLVGVGRPARDLATALVTALDEEA
ncbi:NAD(P)-binding domain-containing protein [Nocardioides bruguierae]|uniref:NAD(P)/FAD-dependent oxidoreductase n=1 Tax=Nocardioides bruguierae TaxID=2945102 RepID=A0A9X2ID12_9ACTN|nr:NAD(P)-binding domain-containing protein [Nocardioides bruguierae]MCM0619266.1 NAD(P)/FAD-dependent oxidoreductase [Nocardioides bruguierae]